MGDSHYAIKINSSVTKVENINAFPLSIQLMHTHRIVVNQRTNLHVLPPLLLRPMVLSNEKYKLLVADGKNPKDIEILSLWPEISPPNPTISIFIVLL